MVLISSSVLVMGCAFPSSYFQTLHPQAKFQLLPTSPGGSPRSASESVPGFFTFLPSYSAPKYARILYAVFKREVSLLYSP